MFNFAQNLINQGVSEELVYLLLMLPFGAFIVSFFRYYIGLKTFGMYETIMIAFAFYFISPNFVTGLKFGLPLIILAWLVSELFRRGLRGVRLHYVSKISLKISIAALLMIMALWVLSYFGQNGYFTVDPLPIIIILALVESVTLFKVKFGDLRANLSSLETLVVSTLTYGVLTLPVSKEYIILYPYLVILPILGSILIGRFSGLRLSEYIRFKNVKRND
ncbi:MAG: 7TM domain-containing protein [Patescibacteria group bacterium]|nr:7TM domain-containing protein [Patescibacteria group bacterium]